MVFVIHQHESATGIRVPPPPPPFWTPLPHPSPPYPSALSQSTSFGCPSSCINLVLVIYFTYGNVHVSVLLMFVQWWLLSLSPLSPLASHLGQMTRKPAAPSCGSCGKFKPHTGIPTAAPPPSHPFSLKSLLDLLGRHLRRRQWHPSPVLLPGKSHGRRSLGGIFGEGNGTPLQYSCLENPMDGGAW